MKVSGYGLPGPSLRIRTPRIRLGSRVADLVLIGDHVAVTDRHSNGQTEGRDTVIDHGHKPDAETYVTAEEAGRLADVSARTVRRWINAGEIASEDGQRGRLVSVSDVRLRAARGHVRPRPATGGMLSSTTVRTDTDMTAVSTVLSPVLIAHAEQIERLTREAMAEKARADSAEREVEQLSRELLMALIDRGGR